MDALPVTDAEGASSNVLVRTPYSDLVILSCSASLPLLLGCQNASDMLFRGGETQGPRTTGCMSALPLGTGALPECC